MKKLYESETYEFELEEVIKALGLPEELRVEEMVIEEKITINGTERMFRVRLGKTFYGLVKKADSTKE